MEDINIWVTSDSNQSIAFILMAVYILSCIDTSKQIEYNKDGKIIYIIELIISILALVCSGFAYVNSPQLLKVIAILGWCVLAIDTITMKPEHATIYKVQLGVSIVCNIALTVYVL